MKNHLAAFISGLLGSIGVGGGGVLILYLVIFLNEEQITAQGINLLFFIPCAALSTLIYSFKKLISYKNIFILFISSLPGIFIGSQIIDIVNPIFITKCFGLFLVLSGIKTFISKNTN